MIHRGQLLEKKVRESGISITQVAEGVGITRQTMYNWFNTPDLEYKYLKKVGEEINYDFSNDLPESANTNTSNSYPSSDPRCRKILEERDKYATLYTNAAEKLQEKNDKIIELLELNSSLQQQLTVAKSKIPE